MCFVCDLIWVGWVFWDFLELIGVWMFMNTLGFSIFLGLFLGFWGREEYLKGFCCFFGFGFGFRFWVMSLVGRFSFIVWLLCRSLEWEVYSGGIILRFLV